MPINTKIYFSVLLKFFLFRLRLLSENSYLLEGLQSADKTKTHPQAVSYKTHPLLLETDATVMFQQMTYIDAYINFILATCSPPNAKTTIGRYQHTNRPMPITGRLSLNL